MMSLTGIPGHGKKGIVRFIVESYSFKVFDMFGAIRNPILFTPGLKFLRNNVVSQLGRLSSGPQGQTEFDIHQ
jgi:dephospho-CoA kinase